MKKIVTIITIIFISCSSNKEVNSINYINKTEQQTERNLTSLNKEIISLENLYSYEFGNYATTYKNGLKLLKIEYNLSNWNNTSSEIKDNDELKRMRYADDIISIIGEIYFYQNKPILIKEKISRDLGYWSGIGKDTKTGTNKTHSVVSNLDNDFKVYIIDWDKNEIIIKNLFGSFIESDFNKAFYMDLIQEVKKRD